MSDVVWDVAVIGAGAAGLMAAISAAEHGARVLLLEKNRKPGVKILMSGGTRCNITHATDNRGIVAAYGLPGRFLHSALAALSVQDTIDFFEAEGVPTKVEETGKIFPVSNKALDVLNALLARLKRSGATLALEEPLREMSGSRTRFRFHDLAACGRAATGHFDHRRAIVSRQRHDGRRLRSCRPVWSYDCAAAARLGADHDQCNVGRRIARRHAAECRCAHPRQGPAR